jgi:hypothetical protein
MEELERSKTAWFEDLFSINIVFNIVHEQNCKHNSE